jgi:redox-sensing transcriptional repressor
VKRIAESTVRRLSLYLRFLEDFEERGLATISSDELAARGGTTSAQVRKDLSFFGSFGKRGLGYAVPELAARLRDILGLGREWRVIIIGAGKIGSALAQYRGFKHIAVVTVPAEAAQQVVTRVVKSGIDAVMNFAPVQLQVPDHVALKNVNMAMELEGLSFALTNRS